MKSIRKLSNFNFQFTKTLCHNNLNNNAQESCIESRLLGAWIIKSVDRKLADVIGSNIVEKCDVTSSRAIQPLTSDVLRVFN